MKFIFDQFFSDSDEIFPKQNIEIIENEEQQQLILDRLETTVNLNLILKSPSRNYLRIFAHMNGFEFFTLAEICQPFICRSRNNYNNPIGKKIKFDHYHRLYFVLKWLVTGDELLMQQFYHGWSKSVIQLDIIHVLKAIIEALDNYIEWPNAEERQHLSSIHPGLFRNIVGIADVTEHRIQKPKNRILERDTYSGKAGTHTIKTLSVIDYRGFFRFVSTGIPGGKTDREVFTSSVLYLQKADIFSINEAIAADGYSKVMDPSWSRMMI